MPQPVTNTTELPNRFVPRDDPELHAFPTEPGKEVTEEFLAHVRETGRPDLYRWHVHSKPVSTQPPRILTAFGIPEALRTKEDVGRAPCPLCSLRGPKYFTGFLVWFEEERCLRAIGHECGHEFFEGDTFSREQKRFSDARLDAIAVSRLIDGLPLVQSLRVFIRQFAPLTREADGLADLVRKAINRSNRAKLLRLTKGGAALHTAKIENRPLYDRFGSPVLDEDGNHALRPTEVPHRNFTLKGRSILEDGAERAEVSLYAAEAALADFGARGDDEIEACISAWSPSKRADAYRRLYSARTSILRSIERCNDLFAFLSRGNVDNLLSYGRDENSAVGLRGRYSESDEKVLYLGNWTGDLTRIVIPEQAGKMLAPPHFFTNWSQGHGEDFS